jgi:putative beta barrel porin BBP7
MRRTITTLMFLAMSGLTHAAHAADNGNANWQYYAAGASSYRISDDDDGQSPVANAGGQAQLTGQEKNALYVADNSAGSGVLQASFFDRGGDCCNTCNTCNNCGCNQCDCGQNTCLSDCCDCDCTTTMFRLEWLGWFTRARNTPPLVTTSNAADLAVIGNPSTVVRFGGDPIGTNLRNGGRVTLSHLLGDGMTTGAIRFWGIEDGSQTFFTNSDRFPIIGRPFFSVLPPAGEDAFLVAFPGLTSPGSIRVTAKNDLIGLDAWGSRNWFSSGSGSVDILAGYQFTRLDDSLTINSLSTSIDPLAINPVGTTIGISDAFRTRNQFHGGSLGVMGRAYRGAVTLEGLFKVGLGNMHQTVIVNGSTTTTPPGGPASTLPGGILAQPSNIGTQTHNHFCYVPELNANLLYNINSNWRAMVGYSFIYWDQVVLAGNQIDRNVNLAQVGATPPPQPKFQRTDFWVQGISLGGDYRW